MRTKGLITVLLFALSAAAYGDDKMNDSSKVKIAVSIRIKAQPGREADLAHLLKGAAALVSQTEPKTLFWYATQVDNSTFTIHDGFADESGVEAHFSGQVAAALKAKAGEIVEGGWEQGVLPNIEKSIILSTIR